MRRLNRWLDALPRTMMWRGVRPVPVFRSAGIGGFYAAVTVLMATGLLRGLSPVVLLALATITGLSFFAFALVRKWLVGVEDIVLLEHVWFALGCAALLLWATGRPLLAYLDVVCVALPVFLAAGRCGCFLVGCCHGKPSSIGVSYGDAHVRDGLPAWLAGVRVFPVQLVELVALLVIAAVGAVLVGVAAPGRAFEWFLVGYAVVRFGLEGIRGDERPHLLGLSQSRWMALAEVTLVIGLELGSLAALRAPGTAVLAGLPAFALLLALWVGAGVRRNRSLSRTEHVADVRDLVRRALEASGDAARAPAAAEAAVALEAPDAEAPAAALEAPAALTSSKGLSLAVSPGEGGARAHLSIRDPHGRGLEELCQCAARAFPEAVLATAFVSPRGVLHLELGDLEGGAEPARDRDRGLLLWGQVLRAAADPAAADPALPAANPGDHEGDPPPEQASRSRSDYFQQAG